MQSNLASTSSFILCYMQNKRHERSLSKIYSHWLATTHTELGLTSWTSERWGQLASIKLQTAATDATQTPLRKERNMQSAACKMWHASQAFSQWMSPLRCKFWILIGPMSIPWDVYKLSWLYGTAFECEQQDTYALQSSTAQNHHSTSVLHSERDSWSGQAARPQARWKLQTRQEKLARCRLTKPCKSKSGSQSVKLHLQTSNLL